MPIPIPGPGVMVPRRTTRDVTSDTAVGLSDRGRDVQLHKG